MMLQDDEGEEKKEMLRFGLMEAGPTEAATAGQTTSCPRWPQFCCPTAAGAASFKNDLQTGDSFKKDFFFHPRTQSMQTFFCGCCPHSEHSLNVSGPFCPRESKAKQSQPKYLL